jgi:hydroxyethylthiazole kinase-like uncharacterized protein yjeF
MKILDASQLSNLDQYTCQEQNISSWELMERASKTAYGYIRNTLNLESNTIKIFVGPGNNGGDGLAMARFFTQDFFNVEVFLVNFTSSRSEDNLTNLNAIRELSNCKITDIEGEEYELPSLQTEDVLIDAIFGVGLNRSMPPMVQRLIKHINQCSSFTIAIDVPSGMYLNNSLAEHEEILQAELTLTFQTPKLPFYLPDYFEATGEIQVLDIGLSQKNLEGIDCHQIYVDRNFASKCYRPRARFSHKGTYGHALLIGGSQYMLGSIILSSKSCMRSGVGKTSVMMPSCGHSALIQSLPEAMLIKSSSKNLISYTELEFKPNAIGIGVGIGTSEEAMKTLSLWFKSPAEAFVIDADALNLIAKHESLQSQIPKKSILTPHPGELQRLIGAWKDDFEKIEKIKALSKQWDVVIVAKDAFTLCVYKDMVYVNSTGNSGMATAGSGDVLTGLITGLLAQGYSNLDASVLGVYLHGLAADIAVSKSSEESLIATDIINVLGHSFSKLKA